MERVKGAARPDCKFECITDRGSGALNEDSFVADAGKGVFAVFDGAGSLNQFIDSKGRTGGFLASNMAKETFENDMAREKSEDEEKSLLNMTFDANRRIREAMLKEGVDVKDKLNLWVTSVAAIRIHKDAFDWVQVSDTNILVVYRDGSHSVLVKDYEHDRESLMLMKELTEKGVENPRAGIADELIRVRRRMNVTWGDVAGEAGINFLHSGTESLDGVKGILIFSDGLLIPKVNPDRGDDLGAIVKEYEKGGLKGWLRHVREMEDGDPYMRRYVRFKRHDDATAIAVSF